MSDRDRQRRQDWALVLTTLVVAVLAARLASFRWEPAGWAGIAALIAALLGLSVFYRRIHRVDDGRIAETLHETALLVAWGPPVAALSYIVLAPGLTLADGHFAAMDRALGFDWPSWYRYVEARPRFGQVLSALYATSLPHVAIVLIAAGLSGRTDRCRELNRLLFWSAVPVVLISGLAPALSAWIHHGLGLEKAYHLATVTALREGGARELAAGKLLGIITFPSFHTVMAVALIWVCRGIAWLFWPTLLVSAGVLLSIPSEGGHYLVDMIAGASIAASVILLHRETRFSPIGRYRRAASSGSVFPSSVNVVRKT